MFEKIYVFTISQKNIENNPYNVQYIFSEMGDQELSETVSIMFI